MDILQECASGQKARMNVIWSKPMFWKIEAVKKTAQNLNEAAPKWFCKTMHGKSSCDLTKPSCGCSPCAMDDLNCLKESRSTVVSLAARAMLLRK